MSGLSANSYKREEEYFYNENKDLIEERRALLDIERKNKQLQQAKETHWMKCPKCGDQMTEVQVASILIDQCHGCNGLYFDHGELQTLIEIKTKGSIFNSIGMLFDH
ncbi:MAG: zf-TFIIB domain-containing protein [Bdellovibrionales bacterium]